MCLDPAAYVAGSVYDRLTRRGCDPDRAEAIARKVARQYSEKRLARLLAYCYTTPRNVRNVRPRLDEPPDAA